jgi:hypothetical protein
MKMNTTCHHCGNNLVINVPSSKEHWPASRQWAEYVEKLNKAAAAALLDLANTHGVLAVLQAADRMVRK